MTVELSIDSAGCATVLLNRPAKRNALNEEMLDELVRQCAVLDASAELRVVQLRGTGSVFCAGADLADWAEPTPSRATRLSELGRRAFRALAELPVPTIAVCSGGAIGGGLELALACDIVVVADDAKLGFPEPRLANLPSWGGMARLISAVGLARTRHLLLTGALISGADAARYGIATIAAPAAELEQAADGVTRDVLECDREALALIKLLLRGYSVEQPLEAALAAYTAGSAESKARKHAFLNRQRKPAAAVPTT